MASASGNSSKEDLQKLERKRKRMESNRESARRSRMKKQQLLNDLTAKVGVLMRDNGQILATLQVTTQQCLNVEAENSVLRAELDELTHRLHSLKELADAAGRYTPVPEFAGSRRNMGSYDVNQQPIMASADYHVFGY